MKIGTYETHPAADEWPMLSSDELHELAHSIQQVGLREPIRLYEGLVLDGRNRLAACIEVGVEPRFADIPADVDPWEFSATANGRRRHLPDAGRRAAIVLALLEHSQAWQQMREEAKARERAGSQKTQQKQPSGTGARGSAPKVARPREVVAKASGASARTAQDVITVRERDPEAFERVKSGDVSAKKAAKAVREKAARPAAPLSDRRDKPVPDHLAPAWRSLRDATNAVLDATESVRKAIAKSLADLGPVDGARRADGKGPLSLPLHSALQIQRVNRGTETQTDERLVSKAVDALASAVRGALPWIVCPNCGGTGICPGEGCQHTTGNARRCACGGRGSGCYPCEAIGLVTYARLAFLRNSGHPEYRR